MTFAKLSLKQEFSQKVAPYLYTLPKNSVLLLAQRPGATIHRMTTAATYSLQQSCSFAATYSSTDLHTFFIMNFRTIVSLPERSIQLSPQFRVMTIGSCFAEHIGKHLQACMRPDFLNINPTGVLYNPGSIYNALVDLMAPCFTSLEPFAFKASDGMWHHWLYSTKYVGQSKEELIKLLHEEWIEAKRVFTEMDVLLVTFSTDHAYYLTAEGEMQGCLVANCHKQPGRMFAEEVLDPDELYESWGNLLHSLLSANPKLQVVFTLSPYRYLKYGLHENALSKARLLQLIDKLCQTNERIFYFPTYEIITDELRDYRFYDADMSHPSQQAIDYVWEQFADWCFTPEMHEYARDRQLIWRDAQHRPMNPDSTDTGILK